jgi:hypothetical protein
MMNKLSISKSQLFSLSIAVAVVFMAFSFQIAKGDVNSAVTYLKTKTSNSWISMALVAGGEISSVDYLKTTTGTKAIDFEAPILAMTAAGKDPRSFPNENLIAKLKSFYVSNQIGEATILNDDIFGILALISAGEPVNDSVIQGAKGFILQNQNTDGGWSYGVGSSSDTNTTAAAIMALLDAGVQKTDNSIVKAVDYLKGAQNTDGGFPYDPKSSYGTASDSSSDAWVISAINKIGENPASWVKDGNNPVQNLTSMQNQAGYFEYQTGSPEDSFTPTTTSYAVIAFSGKYYPVNKITVPSSPSVSYRVEGSSENLCSGEINAPNALELVKNIASACGFTYHIQDSSFGQYLDQINSDAAQGAKGWLYAVNSISPSVGAADYVLKENDSVLWYYADYNDKLTRLSLDKTEIGSGESVKGTVEYFDAANWHVLDGATLHFGSLTGTTDATGIATMTPADGLYDIYADKSGYVRSETKALVVGKKVQSQLNLNATIESGSGIPNNNDQNSQTGGSVSFSVSGSGGGSNLDFGSLKAGDLKKQNITLQNQGQTKLYLESLVNGDDVFRNYLNINDKSWRQFNTTLQANESKSNELELQIPSTYSNAGAKTGSLIFWGVPTN